MSPILAEPEANVFEEFNTNITVDARHAGGALQLEVEHIEWMGRTLIRVDIPGVVLHLAPHEARDLANALQALATFAEEEAAA